MFSGRTASKVTSGDDEDLRFAVGRLIEDELGFLGSIGVVTKSGEERDSETGSLDGPTNSVSSSQQSATYCLRSREDSLEETSGNDEISIDVGTFEGSGDTLNDFELGHSS